jgi:heparan-alpha-glucosaminide N-acetyltransferase
MSWIEHTDSYFRRLNLKSLWVDEAFLNVSNGMHLPMYLYTLSPDCVKCPFQKFHDISASNDTVIKMKVARTPQMRLYYKDHGKYVFSNESSDGIYARLEPKMGQFGVYDWIINDRAENRFEVAKEPVPIYWCKSNLISSLIVHEKIHF